MSQLSTKTKSLLEKYNLSPNRVLGQNFLIDERAIGDLIDAAEISKDDVVIEVGPGTGNITGELVKRAGFVVAVEKDKKLVELLKDKFKDAENIKIVHQDVLKFNIKNLKFKIKNYKLIAAPPYYLTARLLRHFLQEESIRPTSLSLIIQKEVAEKITAKTPKMNLLAVSVQFYGEPRIVKTIGRNAFWPQPNVDSALLTVKTHHTASTRVVDEDKFFEVVKAGFSAPRKQLAANLSKKMDLKREYVEKTLQKIDLRVDARAENLSVEHWVMLANAINNNYNDNYDN